MERGILRKRDKKGGRIGKREMMDDKERRRDRSENEKGR